MSPRTERPLLRKKSVLAWSPVLRLQVYRGAFENGSLRNAPRCYEYFLSNYSQHVCFLLIIRDLIDLNHRE